MKYHIVWLITLFRKVYSELSNSFIRVSLKISIYHYFNENRKYELKENVSFVLKKEMLNYNLIEYTDRLFENKLFKNNRNSLLDYSISEFF